MDDIQVVKVARETVAVVEIPPPKTTHYKIRELFERRRQLEAQYQRQQEELQEILKRAQAELAQVDKLIKKAVAEGVQVPTEELIYYYRNILKTEPPPEVLQQVQQTQSPVPTITETSTTEVTTSVR